MTSIRIPLGSRKYPNRVALIDDRDVSLIAPFHWTIQKSYCGADLFYAFRYVYEPNTGKRQRLLMHRVILDAPDGVLVDHINGDGLDNRRSNLRLATHRQNHANRQSPIRNKTGYIGVAVSRNGTRFRGYAIMDDGQVCHSASFGSPTDAARAADVLRVEAYGAFARRNFPNEPLVMPPGGVRKVAKARTSPYRGVFWDTAHHRWEVRMCVNGTRVFVGRFADEIEAARAYDRALCERTNDPARLARFLNFPDDISDGL